MKNKKQKSPIFYARTPKMVLMLSMQLEVNVYDTRSKVEEKHHSDFMSRYLSNSSHKEETETQDTTETVLESLLKNNSECAKTLLSSRIATNNKEFNDRDLLFIYNLRMMTKDPVSNQVSKVFYQLNKCSV